MSSACDGDAIASSLTKKGAGYAIGPPVRFSFPYVAPPPERNVAIVMNDAAQQRRVRKFVAGRPTPIAQRRANACASFGQQHMPARYDWLTRLRTARSGWTWHPLLALHG